LQSKPIIVDSSHTGLIICVVCLSPCLHPLSVFELSVAPFPLQPWQVHELCHSNRDDFSRSEVGFVIRKLARQEIGVIMTYFYSKKLEMLK